MRYVTLGRTGLRVSRLGLGGHTFIEELGEGPRPSEEEMLAIVNSVIEGGVNFFDTTHQPERKHLGRCLETLGRRNDAIICVWTFYPGDWSWQPVNRDRVLGSLEEIRSDYIDILIVHHPVERSYFTDEELTLISDLKSEGVVNHLGIGMVDRPILESLPADHPFGMCMTDFNYHNQGAQDCLDFAHAMELGTVALQPFGRGKFLTSPSPREVNLPRAYLKFGLANPSVDVVMNAMREVSHVTNNLPAADEERMTQIERDTLEHIDSLRTAN